MERARIAQAARLIAGLMAFAGTALLTLSCHTDTGGYTRTDDFASNTAASYQSYCLSYGGGSATATISYDPASQKVLLRGVGGYSDVVMKPTDAPAIQPGKDFSFSYDVSVLNEYTGMVYLGDLQGYSSGTWLRFGLDTHAGVVYACVTVNGTARDVCNSSNSATNGTLKISRTGTAYSFYFNGSQIWTGAIQELDGVSLYVGANARVSSGGSGWTAEISIDNWNQVQQ